MRRQRGFTLVELLAVMAIIGILAGVVAGSVSGLGASGQNAQIASDTNTLETAADRFFNASFPQIYPVSDPDTNGDGLLDDDDSPPSPAGDVNVRLIEFDARLPQDPTKTFSPDFVKDIPDSAALVSYRVETSTGAIFSAADGSALIPPAESRFNVNVLDKKTGNTTDLDLKLIMRKNRAAVELLKVQIPAGYIIGGQSLSPGVQVGSLEIFFDVDNPWKPGHVLKVNAPVLATGRANRWTVSPEYSTARSASDGSAVIDVKGAISYNEDGTIIRAVGPIQTHQIDISSATTETPGTLTLEMDRLGGAELAHNEARETWALRLFEHPLGFSDGSGGEVVDLITNPVFDRVYRWIAQEHSTIQVEDIFEQVAGKQAVLIKDTVSEPAAPANTPPLATTQTVEVAEGVPELIELSGIDTDDDSLKFIIASLPLHGTLRDELNGQVGFTPRELFGNGVIYTSTTPGDLLGDSFTFVVNDGREDSAPVTVNISFEDIISPVVSSVDPSDGAAGVARNSNITVSFSEELEVSSLDNSTFTVGVGGAPIPGTITLTGLDAVFDPTEDSLLADITYTVNVTAGVTDLNNNPLEAFTSTFTTVLPSTCQDIRDANPSAGDGEYTISPNGNTFTVYCNDMAGTPSDYLTLVNTGGNFNYGQYTAGGASPSATNVKTNYSKVRLDPVNLNILIGDVTFALSTGTLNHSGSLFVNSMPLGVAMACSGANDNGRANVDLTGTPFFVADPFAILGYPTGNGGPVFRSGNQVVNVSGGGFCGWTAPTGAGHNPVNTRGGYSLSLGFNP